MGHVYKRREVIIDDDVVYVGRLCMVADDGPSTGVACCEAERH